MVFSPIRTTTFDGNDILRLFYNADQLAISAHIGTQWTGIDFGKMKTLRAKPGFLFQFFNGIRKRNRLFNGLPKNEKGQPGGRFPANTWKLGELTNEPIKRWSKFYHVVNNDDNPF